VVIFILVYVLCLIVLSPLLEDYDNCHDLQLLKPINILTITIIASLNMTIIK